MEYSYTSLALALGAASLPVAWSYLSKPNYHPGPTPLPFVGNLLQIPRETPWVIVSDFTGLILNAIFLTQDIQQVQRMVQGIR
jgi:hypothetical protein